MHCGTGLSGTHVFIEYLSKAASDLYFKIKCKVFTIMLHQGKEFCCEQIWMKGKFWGTTFIFRLSRNNI